MEPKTKIYHEINSMELGEDKFEPVLLPNWEYYRRRKPIEIPEKGKWIVFVSKDKCFEGCPLFDVFYSKSSWPIWDTDILWWAYLYLPEGKE